MSPSAAATAAALSGAFPEIEEAVRRLLDELSRRQTRLLSRTFGCVRLVSNKALEERTRAWYGEQRRISYVQSSAALTQWKKTGELAFLAEVSSVPLQQALRRRRSGTSSPSVRNTRATSPARSPARRPSTPAAPSPGATDS